MRDVLVQEKQRERKTQQINYEILNKVRGENQWLIHEKRKRAEEEKRMSRLEDQRMIDQERLVRIKDQERAMVRADIHGQLLNDNFELMLEKKRMNTEKVLEEDRRMMNIIKSVSPYHKNQMRYLDTLEKATLASSQLTYKPKKGTEVFASQIMGSGAQPNKYLDEYSEGRNAFDSKADQFATSHNRQHQRGKQDFVDSCVSHSIPR